MYKIRNTKNCGTHKPGDWRVRVAKSGFQVSASKTKMDWKGRLVEEKYWMPRHPLDTIIPPKEDSTVPFYQFYASEYEPTSW